MRFVIVLVVLTILALAAVCRPAYEPVQTSGPAAADTVDGIRAALDESLGARLFLRGIPGASVAVLRPGPGPVTWTAGRLSALGLAAVTPETVFEGASLSKPVTAYAALRLVQEGRLDLEAPIVRGGHSFTLRQALSHQAGFENSLGRPYEPAGPGGAFRYAGTGFLFVAEEIERVTGTPFGEYMNSVVLPELGMHASAFGASDGTDARLASPHISAVLPFANGLLAATLIVVPLAVVLTLVSWLARLDRDGAFMRWARRVVVAIGVLAVLAGPVLLLGPDKAGVTIASNAVLLALACLAAAGLWRGRPVSRGVGVVLGVVILAVLALRPPLPLPTRAPDYLAAAGLRTTASDYALFLSRIMAPESLDRELAAEMLAPQVEVNEDHDWGLGIGLQRGDPAVIWHWGVNYPGYQALAVGRPATGEAMVVLMNGGPVSLTLGGMRYTGLEAAREAVIAVLGGEHSGYWHGL